MSVCSQWSVERFPPGTVDVMERGETLRSLLKAAKDGGRRRGSVGSDGVFLGSAVLQPP